MDGVSGDDGKNYEVAMKGIRVLCYGSRENTWYPLAVDGLEAAGMEVLRVDVTDRLEDLDEIIAFAPDWVFTINDVRPIYLAEIISTVGAKYVTWLGENPALLYFWRELASDLFPEPIVFCTDSGFCKRLREDGFESVTHLPLAADIRAMRQHSIRDTHRDLSISFVGNSQGREWREIFGLAEIDNVGMDARGAMSLPWSERLTSLAYDIIRQEIGENEADCSTLLYRFVDVCHGYDDNLWPGRGDLHKFEMTLLESGLGEMRTEYLRNEMLTSVARNFSVDVFGSGWSKLRENAKWRGSRVYPAEVASIYSKSSVSLNITSRHLLHAVNSRVFDVPLAGGFVLTDTREDLANVFDLDFEVVVYANWDELVDKLRFYLRNESERRIVSSAARARILAEHTYVHRGVRIREELMKLGSV